MSEQTDQRFEGLSAAIMELKRLSTTLPEIEEGILRFAGLAASLALRILDRPERMSLRLKKHEIVVIPETLTLIRHVAGLQSSGFVAGNMSSLGDLLESRAAELESDLLSDRGREILKIEPTLDMGFQSARIDPMKAIDELERRLGISGPQHTEPSQGEGRSATRPDLGLFTDYVAADLPEDMRLDAEQRIKKDPVLQKFTHDQLIAISKLRSIVMKVDSYRYGVAARRRPLFSKARRNFLSSVPRLGIIMITHVPSWTRYSAIDQALIDVRRYEQHMQDLAMVPEDDDYLCAQNPLIQAARKDAWRISRLTQQVLEDLKNGPSAFRFHPDLFAIIPKNPRGATLTFLNKVAPILNAMATAGIGGRGERDAALSHASRMEMERAARADGPGKLIRGIRTFFKSES